MQASQAGGYQSIEAGDVERVPDCRGRPRPELDAEE